MNNWNVGSTLLFNGLRRMTANRWHALLEYWNAKLESRPLAGAIGLLESETGVESAEVPLWHFCSDPGHRYLEKTCLGVTAAERVASLS
jgi:hypothetical protein